MARPRRPRAWYGTAHGPAWLRSEEFQAAITPPTITIRAAPGALPMLPVVVSDLLGDLEVHSAMDDPDRDTRLLKRVGEVAGILARALGQDAPCANAAIMIARLIGDKPASGELPIEGFKPAVSPEYKRFLDAIARLMAANALMIAGEKKLIGEFRANGRDDVAARREAILWRHVELQKLTESFAAPLPNQPDARSRWHPTARMFASLIERDYQAAGQPAATRNSISSPLITAMQKLFKLAGMGVVEPGAIVKALRKSPRERSSQDKPQRRRS